ncbi:MAG TPA: Uma2 family endonuclease, partial [Thermoanaerobaculia bacterium]
EPELHLGTDVLVPDIAGWRRERLPEYPDVAAFDLAPDWICEVASPSTARLDRIRKLPAYARHGVPFAWIVDPVQKSLEVYELHGEHWTLIATHEGDDVVRAQPFDAIDLNLDALWIL